jgi:hypothetical protein
LEHEFGWSERTAQNFVRVFELQQTKSANFADLSVPLSALYLLAAPSTSEEACDEILQRAQAGERLSFRDVQEKVRAPMVLRVATEENPTTPLTVSITSITHSPTSLAVPVNRQTPQNVVVELVLALALHLHERPRDAAAVISSIGDDRWERFAKAVEDVARFVGLLKKHLETSSRPKKSRRH